MYQIGHKQKIQQQIFIIIINVIFFSLILSGFLVVSAQQNNNWEIFIVLYPEAPAKNQQVFLIVRVEDSTGQPVSGIPLNITLKNQMTGDWEKETQFLNDPYPITGAKGEYTTVFNAPVYEWHRDGVYKIHVRIKLDDGTILHNSKEFTVQEKEFDTKQDTVPEPAAPGAWYRIILYDVEFKPLTVSTFQNGVKVQKTWEKGDWKSAGGMSECNEETGEEKAIYELHSIKDEFTAIYRTDGDSEMLMNMEGYPDKTLIYKFIVTENSGRDIGITFEYYRNGQQVTNSFEIPTIELLGPTYGLSDRLGRWWFFKDVDDANRPGTEQNCDVLIYGIGFVGKVNVKVLNDTDLVFQDAKVSDNYVVLFNWHVPKNISVGYYHLILSGQDGDNKPIQHNIKFYIAEEPEIKCGIERPFLESFEFLFIILPIIVIVLLIILGVAGYSRLKRRKLLNNIFRRRIDDKIKTNPGIHFRALLSDLKLKTGTLSHHITVLEREEYIKEHQDGMYRRFYSSDLQKLENNLIPTVQQKILRTIKDNPGISQSKISKLTGNSRFVVNYHTKILNHGGMISVEKEGRTSHCFYTD